MKKNTILARIDLSVNGKSVKWVDGYFTPEEYELFDDIISVCSIQNYEEDKKAFGAIKKVIKTWNKDIEKNH